MANRRGPGRHGDGEANTGAVPRKLVLGRAGDDGSEPVRSRSPDGQLERGRLPGGGTEGVAGHGPPTARGLPRLA